MDNKDITPESSIEKILVKECSFRGWWCIKFWPVSINGIPDRMILIPGGYLVFVELKRKGKTARKIQIKMAEKLRKFGFLVFENIDSKEKIDGLIKDILDKI